MALRDTNRGIYRTIVTSNQKIWLSTMSKGYLRSTWVTGWCSKFRGLTASLVKSDHQKFKSKVSKLKLIFGFWRHGSGPLKATNTLKKLGSDILNVHKSIIDLPLDAQNVGRWLSKQRQHCKAMEFHSSSKLKPAFLREPRRGINCAFFNRIFVV